MANALRFLLKGFSLIAVSFMAAGLAPSQSSASAGSDAVATLMDAHKYLRLNGQIIEGDLLKKLYAPLGSEPIWVQNGALSPMGVALRQVLQNAGSQGLEPLDYWSPLLETLSRQLGPQTWLSFEMAASNSLLKYAHDVASGRIEPSMVDDDFRFTRKPLDVSQVVVAVQSGPMNLQRSLDAMAPQSMAYQRLVRALARLQQAKAAATFPILHAPLKEIVPGDSNPLISQIKQKLNLLGYPINETSPVFTQELVTVLQQYEDDHNLVPVSKITPHGALLKRLAVGADDRIRQIQLSMEKLRWLPQTLENRHIFVNLAFQQFRLYENNQLTMAMRTVNGGPVHRTPSMRDYIAVLELNPPWAIPDDITLIEKIPEARKNPASLAKSNIQVFDRATGRAVDAASVDWNSLNEKHLPFYLMQMPGYNSALGVVKFKMATNQDAIYLHDTNERNFFTESFRLLSHGCVRLQHPLDLATYLLRDNADWPQSRIMSTVFTGLPDEVKPTQIDAPLTQKIYVYLMYLTAEVDDYGHIRFADDHYGQDGRLAKTIAAPKVAFAGAGPNLGNGWMQVNGQPGPTQLIRKAIAYRCDPSHRGACDAPVSFDLNQPQELASGSYIVGFENSLHAGWVQVVPGQVTSLELTPFQLPGNLQHVKSARVYRAMENPIEQKKMLWAYYQIGRLPFGESEYNFGDLYPTAAGEHDLVGKVSDDLCAKVTSPTQGTLTFREVCQRATTATSMMDIADNFKFGKDGKMKIQMPITPFDVTSIKLGHQLIAAPVQGADTMLAFPGIYTIAPEGLNPTSYQVGQISENY